MKGRVFVGFLVAAVLWVVPAISESPSADSRPDPDSTWLVVGVQPSNMRMEVDEIAPFDDARWRFHYAMSLAAYYPVDGFIVVKVKAGATYGLGGASVMSGKIFGLRFQPCNTAAVFQAEPGKVLYFTSISFEPSGREQGQDSSRTFEHLTYSQDVEGARAFLKAHYPGLSENMERGQCKIVPLALHSCQPQHGLIGLLANPGALEKVASPTQC